MRFTFWIGTKGKRRTTHCGRRPSWKDGSWSARMRISSNSRLGLETQADCFGCDSGTVGLPHSSLHLGVCGHRFRLHLKTGRASWKSGEAAVAIADDERHHMNFQEHHTFLVVRMRRHWEMRRASQWPRIRLHHRSVVPPWSPTPQTSNGLTGSRCGRYRIRDVEVGVASKPIPLNRDFVSLDGRTFGAASDDRLGQHVGGIFE